jgi:hypothetical protein
MKLFPHSRWSVVHFISLLLLALESQVVLAAMEQVFAVRRLLESQVAYMSSGAVSIARSSSAVLADFARFSMIQCRCLR